MVIFFGDLLVLQIIPTIENINAYKPVTKAHPAAGPTSPIRLPDPKSAIIAIKNIQGSYF